MKAHSVVCFVSMVFLCSVLAQSDPKAAENPLNAELQRTILMGNPSRYDTTMTVDEKTGETRFENISPTQKIADLIKRGADPNHVSSDGTPVLMLAIQYGNFRAAQELLAHGAKAAVQDSRKRTPMHLACGTPQFPSELLADLLKGGVNVNATDEDGITPLMIASANDNLKVVQWLIEHGANANAKTKDGATALSMAQQKKSKNSPVLTSPYFTLPDDSPISLKVIPPALATEIVAKVGEGGVTREEFEAAKKSLGYSQGLDEARAEGAGYSVKKVTLNSQDEAVALWNAIDQELLFQGAIDDGIVESPHMKNRILQEFHSKISAMPEVKKEKEDPYRFMSMTAPDLSEFTEDKIQAYYQEHPEKFQAPARIRVKNVNWPANADEGGMGRRHLEELRANPQGSNEWQGDEWVIEGYNPTAVMDGSLDSDLPKLFQTPKGSVSPILRGVVYLYVFWVIDREESSGLRPLADIKDRVLYHLAAERLKAYNEIRKNDPEQFYRMALQKGFHRRLKGEAGSALLNKFYNPPPGRKREDVLAELKAKYPVEILLKDAVYNKDQRTEYRKKKEREEMEALMPQLRRVDPAKLGKTEDVDTVAKPSLKLRQTLFEIIVYFGLFIGILVLVVVLRRLRS